MSINVRSLQLFSFVMRIRCCPAILMRASVCGTFPSSHCSGEHLSEDGAIVSLALSPGESYIAVGFMSGTVGFYDTSLRGPMMTFQAHNSCLRSLAISPSGIIATASEDMSVKLWTWSGVVTGSRTLQQRPDFVMAVAFAPNDPIVFTGSRDGTIQC
jgi:WD40 repeat protein